MLCTLNGGKDSGGYLHFSFSFFFFHQGGTRQFNCKSPKLGHPKQKQNNQREITNTSPQKQKVSEGVFHTTSERGSNYCFRIFVARHHD